MAEPSRVLLVEDDPDVAELTVSYLDRLLEDVEVGIEHDAGSGFERFEDGDFECLISDYDMPREDGISFLERVRRVDPDVPFILFTGKGSEEVASEAISKGVTDYVQKGPTERFELLANRVEAAIREYRTRRFTRATKHRPEELLERITDAFFALDTDWRFTYVNAAAAATFDADPDALLGATIWEHYPGDARGTIAEEYESAVATGTPQVIEVHHEATDRWQRQHLYPTAEGLAVISEDITDQKEAEERLWMLYEFHEAIIESANALIAVADPADNVVIWNEAAARITGYPAPEVVGDDDIWGRLLPGTGGPPLAGETTVEVPIETAGGDRRMLSWSTRAIEDGSGSLLGVVVVARDVTARHDRERTLVDQAERLEQFEVAFPDIALIIDANYRYAAYLSGRDTDEKFLDDPDEMVGRQLQDYLPDSVLETHVAAIDEVLESGGEQRIEYQLSVPAGDRWFEGRIAPLPHEVDGEPAVILVTRDITERKRRERQLERFEAFIENSPDIFMVLDERATITYRSEHPGELLGYEEPNWSGIAPEEIIHPDDIPSLETDFARLLARPGEIVRSTYRAETAAGTYRWYENVAVNYLNDPAIEGILVVARDIHERRQRELDLERERNRFRTLFEHLPTPAVHVRMPEGEPIVNQVNSSFAETFGADPDAVRDEPLDDVIVPEGAKAEADSLNERALSRGGFTTEVTRETVDGPREFRLTTAIDGSITGDPEGYAIYVDLSDEDRSDGGT